MTGSGVLPTEFFHVGSALGKTVLIGMICAAVFGLHCSCMQKQDVLMVTAALGVAAIYSAFLWRQRQEPDDDSE